MITTIRKNQLFLTNTEHLNQNPANKNVIKRSAISNTITELSALLTTTYPVDSTQTKIILFLYIPGKFKLDHRDPSKATTLFSYKIRPQYPPKSHGNARILCKDSVTTCERNISSPVNFYRIWRPRGTLLQYMNLASNVNWRSSRVHTATSTLKTLIDPQSS